jgi:DNA-binding response OmpR family regulator
MLIWSILNEPEHRPEKVRILVVEDDRELRRIMHDTLEDEGFVVKTARDGRQAVEAAARWRPALVVLDMALPALNGDGVAAYLRTQQPHPPPILLVTADGNAARKARQVGAFAYLAKPLELDELVSVVRRGLQIT